VSFEGNRNVLAGRGEAPVEGSERPSVPALQQFGLRLAFFANLFKVPTLWGVKDTAPYFHDNSAKDFDDLLKQYDLFFVTFFGDAMTLTPQDRADIKAFLKLL
jgi:cytochrome c peroxidase